MNEALYALIAEAAIHTQTTGAQTFVVDDYRIVTNGSGELISVTRR